VAFELLLVYLVDEQQTLAAPNWGCQRDQATASIYAQGLGAFVERFAFDCPSIDQNWKIDPEAAALAAFRVAIAFFV